MRRHRIRRCPAGATGTTGGAGCRSGSRGVRSTTRPGPPRPRLAARRRGRVRRSPATRIPRLLPLRSQLSDWPPANRRTRPGPTPARVFSPASPARQIVTRSDDNGEQATPGKSVEASYLCRNYVSDRCTPVLSGTDLSPLQMNTWFWTCVGGIRRTQVEVWPRTVRGYCCQGGKVTAMCGPDYVG
jgi:hypothetical protein